jgi:ABC-2 type transport system ATP-binding protein
LDDKIVTISNLSKSFDKQKTFALKSINAKFSAGKIVGLIGPDGAGKTTLIRIMAGLLKPTSGNVSILGNDTILNADNIYELIGYMPQKFGLYEDLTVIQNLNLYAELQNLLEDEKQNRFETLLRFTALKPFIKRLARDLSGGMKQKLGLACALLRKPKFLILDEPSVGVDPISRRELWTMITELAKDNVSILWSTSYLDEAEKCQEVLILNKGEMLYYGLPNNLTDKLKGRTFQIQNIDGDRRSILTTALQQKNVLDGVIQGSAVRIVFHPNISQISIDNFKAGKNATLKTVQPRFEDAFMDLLGGAPKGESPLASLIPTISNSDGKPVIEVKGLTKRFGNFTAASKITFSVKKGEIFGLLGPNGAGKSTTFKMLCGLLKPTDGEAFIGDLSIRKVTSEARARIGYMAQKFSLYNNMNVIQNLNFFSGIYGVNPKKRADIIHHMIKTFDLTYYIHTPTFELPLGFKQRLALSCAIMHNPEVLFLDEPTSGVDPITRREFWSHINAMVSKNVAIVITTHFMDEAEYCDRIGLINHGELITIGSPDDLKKSVQSKDLPSPTLEDAFVSLSLKQENRAHV